MEMFKKLGPRVVLVELRGRVCGLVTVKDVLKYQFKVENEENPRREGGAGEEWLWGWIESVGRVLGGLWSRVGRRGGGIRIEHTPRLESEEEVELVETPR
jgi:chloride channel 3/4/5